ncbi:MAG: hypothetical protein V1738_05790 [Patescibacteria group bacterium]
MFKPQQPPDNYFDDCPICRAMKCADEQGIELGLEDLLELFAEAKQPELQVDTPTNRSQDDLWFTGRGGVA